MTKGFRIDGHFIPIRYDTSGDKKLQVSELSIWCKENDFEYDAKTKKIVSSAGQIGKSDFSKRIDFNKYSLESFTRKIPK